MIGYAIVQMLWSTTEVIKITPQDYVTKDSRVATSLWFFSGILDLFVSCMAWFITDEDYNPNFMRNSNTGEVYQIL